MTGHLDNQDIVNSCPLFAGVDLNTIKFIYSNRTVNALSCRSRTYMSCIKHDKQTKKHFSVCYEYCVAT